MNVYVAYITGGSYSYYSVSCVMLGDADPTEIIDALVARESGGRWRSAEHMAQSELLATKEMYYERDRLRSIIYAKFVPELVSHGFKEVESKEVWTGD